MTHIVFLIAALLGQAFMDGLLCVPTYIDAKLPKKLQYFKNISQNSEKLKLQARKRADSPEFGLLPALVAFY